MIDSAKSEAGPTPVALQGEWSKRPLDQIYVDEANLQYINERVYLTFGQLQAPSSGTNIADELVEIRPVVRVVLTKASFDKIVTMLGRVSEQIAKSGSDEE
jgi:hypothetical protein